MSYVPNELNITMNTNMPGFSKLKYKPDMTIKGLKSKNIQFNPLIKLNDTIVKDTYAALKLLNPKMLISELFLEKAYFNTLLSYHKSTKWIQNITLEQAHYEGNVDNNIKITLKYVFEPKSLIYLKDEPYSIGALNWTIGDWKLDTKEKAQFLPTYNPYLRSAMINTRILSGDNELQALSKFHPNLMKGPNYVPDPSIFAAGITPSPPVPYVPQSPVPPTPYVPPPPYVPPSPYVPPPPYVQPSPILPPTGPNTKLILPPTEPNSRLAITNEPDIEILPDVDNKYMLEPVFSHKEVAKMRLPFELHNKKNSKDVNAQAVLKYVSDMGIDTTDLKKLKKKSTLIDAILNEIKTPSTKKIQTYFHKGEFYKMLNSVYVNFDDDIKTSINNVFMTQTPVQAGAGANLSKAAYESVIESLNVYPNAGGGDCFFIAIADAINNYNYVNINTKIKYDRYGVSRKFTVDILRTIVYDYLMKQGPDIIDIYVHAGVDNAHRLNNKFEENLKLMEEAAAVSSHEYLQLAHEIYGNDISPIFVKIPTNVPNFVENHYAPFSAVSKTQIEPYIKSKNYWADEIAIYAMANLLKINVIVLEEKNNLLNSLCLIYDNTVEQIKDWDKYLFLYYSAGHYELVTFNFTRKLDNKNLPVPTITIFNRNPPRVNPKKTSQVFYIVPYYIIFCMFGSCYYPRVDDVERRKFDFLKLQNVNIFEITNRSVNKIILNVDKYTQTNQSYNRAKFIETFNRYFPDSDIQAPPNETSPVTNKQRTSPRLLNQPGQEGGYYYPVRSQPPYPQYQSNPNFTKEESDVCYTIKIDLMLRKGASISDEELNTLLCNARWNEITKPLSTILNKTHSIRPDVNFAIITDNPINNPVNNPINKPVNNPINNPINKTVNNRYAQNLNNKTKKIR